MFLSQNAVHSVLKDGMNAILILNVSKSKCSSFRFNVNIRVNTLNNGMNGSFDFRAPPSGELLNLKMMRAQDTLTVFMPKQFHCPITFFERILRHYSRKYILTDRSGQIQQNLCI